MTTKKRLWGGMAAVVLLLSVVMMAGCLKKDTLQDETRLGRGEMPQVKAPEKPIADDRAAPDSTPREPMPKDGEGREPTPGAREAEETAAERAQRAAVESEAAIRLELRIPPIHFDFNEYTLTPESREILTAAAPAYLKYTDYQLIVEGHCDPRGTAEYNLALGQRRADEAAQFLIHLGIGKERIRTISYGKERPLDPGQDETAWARNRRVQFVISKPAG